MTSTSLELEIVATGRPRLVQSLRELWAYRGTILAFAERDVQVNGISLPARDWRAGAVLS